MIGTAIFHRLKNYHKFGFIQMSFWFQQIKNVNDYEGNNVRNTLPKCEYIPLNKKEEN